MSAAVLATALVLGACGDSTSSTATTQADSSPNSAAASVAPVASTAGSATTVEVDATPVTTAAVVVTTGPASPSTVASGEGAIVNTWSGAAVDPTALPIGDDFVSTEGPGVGLLWACEAGDPNAAGAQADGPWLDITAGTWDSTTKLVVEGSVVWEEAGYTESVADDTRVLTSNKLPVEDPTGNFPIAADDPTYQYDRNPGGITEQAFSITLPSLGTEAESPSCMQEGPVGLFRNGVVAFNSLDARGDDAVAHESQDLCNGHPARTTYHYHSVPICLQEKATGPSTVVGFAFDGFPIVVERDSSGALPTNADLDECHGRTSPILLDGEVVTTYHYSATLEFPYYIGCYKGTVAPVGR